VRSGLRTIRPGTVLEIGCGQGAMGSRIAAMAEYVGVEPDPLSFAKAAHNIEPFGGRVLNGMPGELDLGDPVDLVCAFEVLEHIEDDRTALGSWIESVRPGGHLMLSVPAFARRYGAADVRSGHFRRYDPEELRSMLADAGLVDVRVDVYAWPLGYLLEAVRNRRDARILREQQLSLQEHTSASGRTDQPSKRSTGTVIAIGTAPFLVLQRFTRRHGTGLVAVARRPGVSA
jgi:SAM-dependent methyltransferase